MIRIIYGWVWVGTLRVRSSYNNSHYITFVYYVGIRAQQ